MAGFSKGHIVEARIRHGVRLRKDVFGGICYVPHRDDFFAAPVPVFRLLQSLESDWAAVPAGHAKAVIALAKLGVCETQNPATKEASYSGPSFLGPLKDIPSVSDPLVLNCFATSHCPLKCVYCHADDLMQEFRDTETEEDIDNIIATVNMIPAMVVVITGGDPLTRPERSRKLIERIGRQKALVLDTSGVGDMELLIPTIKQHAVHVRVSLDSVSESNDRARPTNREYVAKDVTSRRSAERIIDACVREGIPLTVQTVVSRLNENLSEWQDLRWWLLEKGVRHWVIHVAIKGGSARRIENEKARDRRPVGILPGPNVFEMLNVLINETIDKHLPIDVRCTDTGSTPNSVLLVNSRGSLYTEGLAHNGKVELYSVDSGRADSVRALWAHVDEFGHARRYLNWNPWRYAGRSLEDVCYRVPLEEEQGSAPTRIVETEGKYRVQNRHGLADGLIALGFEPESSSFQRDEYFDSEEKSLEKLDFVVRLRREGTRLRVAIKGPRFFTSAGANSRVELELPCHDEELIQSQIAGLGLRRSWVFEKRRNTYRALGRDCVVAVDEVPDLGFFVEIEGPVGEMQEVRSALGDHLGPAETRNYASLYRDFMASRGKAKEEIDGAVFSNADEERDS